MHLPFFQRRGGKLGNPASPNSNVHANHAAILLAIQFLIQLVGSGTQDFAFPASSLVGHMGFSVLSQGGARYRWWKLAHSSRGSQWSSLSLNSEAHTAGAWTLIRIARIEYCV